MAGFDGVGRGRRLRLRCRTWDIVLIEIVKSKWVLGSFGSLPLILFFFFFFFRFLFLLIWEMTYDSAVAVHKYDYIFVFVCHLLDGEKDGFRITS